MDNNYHKGFKSDSLTIILDSTYRNHSDWSKVEEFSYGHTITSSWPMYKSNKTDKRNYSMRLISVVIPYRAALLTDRYYMVSISHTNDKMHRRLLNGSSNPGYHRSNFLVCVQKIVGTDWIYLAPMTPNIHTTVLLGGGEFHFAIFDSYGVPLTINTIEDPNLPANQVSAIFDLTPL